MEIYKKEKFRLMLLIIIIFISIIEIYVLYRLCIDYKWIYQVYSFILLVLLQVIGWYRLMFKNNNVKRLKLRIVIFGLITIFIPVLIMIDVPKYSYQDGKTMIEKSIEIEGTYEFIENSRGKNTIPVINNPKGIFIANRDYYYRLSDGINNIYFIVNPIDGRVMQLDNAYWTED